MRQLDYLVHNVDNCAMILTTETGLISMQWRLIGSNDFINDLCLQNIPLLDRLFTWSNNQDSPTLSAALTALQLILTGVVFSLTPLFLLAPVSLHIMCPLFYKRPPRYPSPLFFVSITTGQAPPPSHLLPVKIGKAFYNTITMLLRPSVFILREYVMPQKSGIKIAKTQVSQSQTAAL